MDDSVSSTINLRGEGNATTLAPHAITSPPVLQPKHQSPSVSTEEQPQPNKNSMQNASQSSMPSSHNVDSSISTPTNTSLVDTRGCTTPITPRWTEWYIHKWKSPVLMALFFGLGATVSIAHCVFYAKLNGRIVGDSSKQEEKLRYERRWFRK